MTQPPIRVLVLGAAYGMLPGVKLSLAGHAVTLVGREEEIAAMAASGLSLTLPMRKEAAPCVLRVPVAECASAGHVALTTPEAAAADQHDFVILAMQEPQFAAPEVAGLMQRLVAAGLPCLSIMNLPPRPYLAALGSVPQAALEGVYASDAVWRGVPAERLSVACPDAQAVRLDPARAGDLTVTLPSNFKATPFADPAAQALLERLAHDMSRLKVDGQRPPVYLLARQSRFVPLAKWPMLLAGNFRCLTAAGLRPIADAVWADPDESRAIYAEVLELVHLLGAPEEDLVPFATYAAAARQLVRPSSVARALAGGAQNVERIDRLVANLLRANLAPSPRIEAIAGDVDARLAANRARA